MYILPTQTYYVIDEYTRHGLILIFDESVTVNWLNIVLQLLQCNEDIYYTNFFVDM